MLAFVTIVLKTHVFFSNVLSIPNYQYQKRYISGAHPNYTTVEFDVTKGDSLKITYETYIPKTGETELIPIQISMPDIYSKWWLDEDIRYTYLNYAKYYECLRYWGTSLDIYAFEYPSLDFFDITIIPDTLSSIDTLAFTELAKLVIQADSSIIELDSTKLLRFEVTTNTAYGTFIKPNGDTLVTQPSEPVVLENITYADAKNGKVKFAAVKANPDSVVKCNIKVILQEDTTKYGERDAVVLEQTLRIVMDEPFEVRPNVSNIVNLADVALGELEQYRKPFFVSLKRGKKYLGGHSFKIETDFVAGSGGHDHHNGDRNHRPSTPTSIKYWNYGHFRKTDSSMVLYNLLEDTTMINYSENEYNYLASRWGDTMKVYLKSKENKLLQDSISIVEKIDSLIELGSGTNYVLVGGTCNHHGPNDRSIPDSCLTPNNNHYGTRNTLRDIIAIADAWHSQYPDEQTLRINDMSLPFGGKFDVNGTWLAPHATHREGRDVDVRSELHFYPRNSGTIVHRRGVPMRVPRNEPANLPNNSNFIPNPNSRLQEFRPFVTICDDNHGEAHIHDGNSTNEHYHIDFDNEGE